MKKTILKILMLMIVSITIPTLAQAYTIGGAYASLIRCTWGQYGYQQGYIGLYNVNGIYYQVFFGSNYCKY